MKYRKWALEMSIMGAMEKTKCVVGPELVSYSIFLL